MFAGQLSWRVLPDVTGRPHADLSDVTWNQQQQQQKSVDAYRDIMSPAFEGAQKQLENLRR